MIRKTVLLLAYSVSPIRGSEYSVGWNYICEMSQDNNLIVLYGLAGDHMGDIYEVALSPTCQNLPNVEWLAVQPNRFARLLNTLNRKGLLTYSFYLAYRVWHYQAYQIALQLVQSRNIDLIHYLCPIGYREPGYLWKIDKPYIWGPVGGVENRSAKLVLSRGLVPAFKVLLRNSINTLQFKFGLRFNNALKHANLLFSATTGVQKHIKMAHNIDSIALPENAITDDMLDRQRVISLKSSEPLEIIWVGSIDERKSLDILIKALAPIKGKAWRLTVIGDGVLRTRCFEMARNLRLNDQIDWIGKIPRLQVNQYYLRAHIHVITSLLEANTTVIWEAMSFGIPTITLDHYGMHDTVCEKCGFKVPVEGSLQSIIEVLTQKIADLINNPEMIQALSIGVRACSRCHTWAQRRRDWIHYYDEAINNWRSSKKHVSAV